MWASLSHMESAAAVPAGRSTSTMMPSKPSWPSSAASSPCLNSSSAWSIRSGGSPTNFVMRAYMTPPPVYGTKVPPPLGVCEGLADVVDRLEIQPERVDMLVRHPALGVDDHGRPARPHHRRTRAVGLRDLLVRVGQKRDRDAVLVDELRMRVQVLVRD